MSKIHLIRLSGLWLWMAVMCTANPVLAAAGGNVAGGGVADGPWWWWPFVMLVFCLFLGVLTPLAGVGRGILFVAMVSAFFPFHLDFVRGTGLLVSMAGALAAGSGFLRRNLANLRLCLPMALIMSLFAVLGAFVGLALPTSVMQVSLGVTIILIAVLLIVSTNKKRPATNNQDFLGWTLGMSGVYRDEVTGERVEWTSGRTFSGFLLFMVIGMVAGMFGMGAGWANVSVLNLVMGVPFKVAVGSGEFLFSVTSTAAAWVYLNEGTIFPLIAIPSVVGFMIGSFVGVRIATVVKLPSIRFLVIAALLVAGGRVILKGFGIG